MSQYDKNFVYTISFNVSEAKEWVSQYKKIWSGTESQLFEKLATEPIKGGDKYVHGKLKTWKEHINTNLHGQDVEECKYTNAEQQQCNMLSDDDNNRFFEV